ncbi:MAG: helix-turn-helix domain-containing protein [Cetobacterium sp.]|uniref:helix-turn-helix domain-containing protein n=1 Tax=Cetobacterium sp. TaxID=2071632 RepID=UPI002FCB6E04
MSKIDLTEDQKERLGIKDERVDFYFKIENAVIDNPEIFSNIYESHLFMVLARFCNNGKVAFPSYNTLAKLCYCSKSTIIRSMKSLEDKKLINKVVRVNKIRNNHVNDTNLYTINNVKEYVVKDKSGENIGGVCETLGVVSERNHPSICETPNKELVKKNNEKKNTTTREEKMKTEKISSRYDFLDSKYFSKINSATKRNIRKNIENLTEERAKEIYSLTEKVLEKGKGKSFDAIFYSGVSEQWNFEIEASDINSGKENRELEPEKKSWLGYFSGIVNDKEIYESIQKIIISIPMEILKTNKSKLARMTVFEFKQHLIALKKSQA